jgi:hypothetical protein
VPSPTVATPHEFTIERTSRLPPERLYHDLGSTDPRNFPHALQTMQRLWAMIAAEGELT